LPSAALHLRAGKPADGGLAHPRGLGYLANKPRMAALERKGNVIVDGIAS